MNSDLIYHHHPSVRLDIQNPLSLQPTTPTHSPALIENYYTTGIHSTNILNETIYILRLQHRRRIYGIPQYTIATIGEAGFPATPEGFDSATTKTIDTPPEDELDDEPL